ncbi:hypothetical protein FC093_03715 [Ilyomonas limi]|uniref:Uncharacterized protein n=1 Tax=Ilyomonas limi TaxID=2575867 RepID=A0A4V5UUY1_9BACT|nr:hypothetical protein [Ilyomonas limi]TKK70813.1 hypothetical protein FC093_03715 [Ilyomonas limi]
MKRIFYTVLLLMSVAFTITNASAQPRFPRAYDHLRLESFFYYPQTNVYYSFRTHQYIYPSHGGWQIAYRLPHHVRIGKADRITIEHRGFDVWNDNAKHQYAYGRRYNTPPAIVYTPDRRYNGF